MKKIVTIAFIVAGFAWQAYGQKSLTLFGHALGESAPTAPSTHCEPDSSSEISTCGDSRLLYRNGKLVIIEDSIATTDTLLADAIKKFGPPTAQKWETVQNAFGAKFRNRILYVAAS